jgi:hypothetical protein
MSTAEPQERSLELPSSGFTEETGLLADRQMQDLGLSDRTLDVAAFDCSPEIGDRSGWVGHGDAVS